MSPLVICPYDTAHQLCVPTRVQFFPSDHLPVGAVLRLKQPSLAAYRQYGEQWAAQEEAEAAAAAAQ